MTGKKAIDLSCLALTEAVQLLNSTPHETPVWNRCRFLHDLTLSISSNEVQVKNKGSRWVKYLTGLDDVPIDIEGEWEPGNPAFDVMQEAYWSKEPLEFVILDGGIRKDGAQGLRGEFIVTKFERSEPKDRIQETTLPYPSLPVKRNNSQIGKGR
ncbi:hypothetical protein FACS1894170_10000 [Planctomycetales bacterium]|nr:hypothetical protein FACS1894170_10000 [Planctomycetales bacterium]